MIVFSQLVNGQEYDTDYSTLSTQEANLSIVNNKSNLKLFDINIGDKKIPFELFYDHSGLMVNHINKSPIGYGWSFTNLGKIDVVTNQFSDFSSIGWVNQPLPSVLPSPICSSDNCQTYPDVDLMPDIFLLNSSIGIDAEFIFLNNTLPPVQKFLNKSEEISIEVLNYNSNNGQPYYFNIKDSEGNSYLFNQRFESATSISLGYEGIMSSYEYVLTSFANPNKLNEFLNINYHERSYSYESPIYTGYTSSTSSYYYDNNICENLTTTQKSTTNRTGVYSEILTAKFKYEFIYSNSNNTLLTMIVERNVIDNSINNKYKFEYNVNQTPIFLLERVVLSNALETESIILYEFNYDENYYTGSKDYLGFHNLNQDGSIRFKRANDFNQNNDYLVSNEEYNLDGAKTFSLVSIKNHLGNEKVFEYKLKLDELQNLTVYGGGLVIDKITEKHKGNVIKSITYNYFDLTGKYFDSEIYEYEQHFWQSYNSGSGQMRKRFTNIDSDGYFSNSVTKKGNFYAIIEELFYDKNNVYQGKTKKQFINDNSSLFYKPKVQKISHFNQNNLLLSEVINNYNNINYASIPYIYKSREKRLDSSSGNFHFLFSSFSFDNTNLISKTKNTFLNGQTLTETKNYNYLSSNSSLVDNISTTDSNGNIISEKFYYPVNTPQSSAVYLEMLNKKMFGIITDYEVLKNNNLISSSSAKYINFNNLIKQEKIETKLNTNVPFSNRTNTTWDSMGNLTEFNENFVSTSVIYGYNKTKIIAIIKNTTNSNLASLLSISDIHSLNENSYSIISGLRSNANLEVQTFEYNIKGELIKLTDEKGMFHTNTYDPFGRLLNIKDNFNNILKDYEYNIKNN
jgi:YD repeat-containing protein